MQNITVGLFVIVLAALADVALSTPVAIPDICDIEVMFYVWEIRTQDTENTSVQISWL